MAGYVHGVCDGGHIIPGAGIDDDMRFYDSIIDLVCDGDYGRRDKIGSDLSIDDLEIIYSAIQKEKAVPQRDGQKPKLMLIVSQAEKT